MALFNFGSPTVILATQHFVCTSPQRSAVWCDQRRLQRV
ncbi:Hypothetical protein RAK1035_0609 [Roseovarius sp. AK1035]|nr:Hypothetical protein RAK1035_0609 [Roseovarius sp. AK1035]